jgi:hypothetical protein
MTLKFCKHCKYCMKEDFNYCKLLYKFQTMSVADKTFGQLGEEPKYVEYNLPTNCKFYKEKWYLKILRIFD